MNGYARCEDVVQNDRVPRGGERRNVGGRTPGCAWGWTTRASGTSTEAPDELHFFYTVCSLVYKRPATIPARAGSHDIFSNI